MRPTRVAVVDDEPGYADLVGARLERTDGATVVATADDPREALEVVRNESVDCVVSDYDMPHMNGLELFEAMQNVTPGLSYVLVTGVGGETLVGRAREAGVTACVRKDGGRSHYDRLVAAVRNAAARNATDGVDDPSVGRSESDP